MPAPDREPDQPEPHRDREEPAADVVAPAQDDRARGDVLRRLRERDRRDDQHRHHHPARAPDLLGERRERAGREHREHPADELVAERDLEQAAKPPPALRLGVAEAELHERLLDRQVEELLEEGRRRDRRRRTSRTRGGRARGWRRPS